MNKNLKTIAIACLCAVAVLSTGFSAVTLMRVRQLEQNVSAVQHSVTSIDSDINSTLNSAITTITESAQKNASIVSRLLGKLGRVQPERSEHADDYPHHAKGIQ